MTPEERAAKTWDDLNDLDLFWEEMMQSLAVLAAAIRAAVDEERERCAKVADDVYDDDLSMNFDEGWERACREIAKRIREGKPCDHNEEVDNPPLPPQLIPPPEYPKLIEEEPRRTEGRI